MTDWRGGNPYDAVLADQDRQTAGAAISTANANPDHAARANRIARMNGLPADTVLRNLQSFEDEAQKNGAIQNVQQSDYLQRWYSDPNNAAAARDDTPALKQVADHGGFFSALGNVIAHPLDAASSAIDAADKWIIGDTGKGDGVATPVVAATAALMGDPDAQARIPTVLRRAPAALASGVGQMVQGAAGYVRGTQEVAEGFDPTANLQRRLFGGTIEGAVGGAANTVANAADAYAKQTLPPTGDWITDQILGGISNVPSTALALGTGLAGRAVGLGVEGASAVGALTGGVVQGGQSYQTGREQGLTPGQAFLYANIDAATETAGEYLGESSFLHATEAGGSVLSRFLKSQLGEQVGEQFSTVAQDFSAWAMLPENKHKTFGDFAAQLPGDMASTAVQTLVAGGISNLTISGIERAADLPAFRARAVAAEAQRSRANTAVLDSFIDAAAPSKLRERDPEAFSQFVAGLANDTAAENVYIPAEAIRELHQDYAEHPFFSQYAGQIREALALDGDVVIPTSEVATHLAGTPEWESLRNEARFTPGGLSPAELKSLESTHADYMSRIGDEIAQHAQAAAVAAEPRNQVYQNVRDQLANAGFAPDAADRYAQLWAANREAWGTRLGTDALSYHEANPVEFRRILPENLAKVQAADGLDVVIHAMKRDKATVSDRQRFGPSLLEWISQRGGINDPGGDIASMGGDRWHRDAPFRRKLLRLDGDERQGSMMETGNHYGVDDTLSAAIEAGYFPELDRMDAGEDAANAHDTGPLLDAIRDELHGSPRYAVDETEQNHTDEIRRAADELRAELSRRGIDADTASAADIRKAIELHQEDTIPGERELEQAVRGRALIGDNPGAIIDLFQRSDLSTVIHETGHVWLEELKRNATAENAPEDVKQDWQTVQDWFAKNGAPIGEDGFIPTEAHELWARGWERYAMEGKAPSSALQRAFDAFRGWMLSIYRHVSNLRVDLSPEVRQVFDRMLATQDAINEERDRQNVRALFTDAAQAGMTEAEFAAYQQVTGTARSEAFDALLYRTMAAIRAQRTKAWREEERSVRDDVTARVNSRPEFQALNLLRTGTLYGEPERERTPVKLDRQWVVEHFGEDALSMLPKSVPPIYKEGGAHPDEIAEMVGYRTGEEMVSALMGVERAQAQLREEGEKGSIRQRSIDAEVAATMDERHGDPLRDGSIEEEALAAIYSDRQGEVIASEARALGRQRGRAPTPYQIAKEWAARKIAQGTVVDVASRSAIQRYARAAAKAAKGAEVALFERNTDEAFRQKQAQLLNQALLVEAKRAANDVDAAVDRLSKIAKRATMKSVDQGYLDQAHNLLEAFDFRVRSQRSIDEHQSFQAWAAQQEANGVDVVVPPRLGEQGVHYTRMSVEELRGLDDSVKQIIHLGRLKQTLIDAKETRDFNEVVGEAQASGDSITGRPPATLADPGFWEGVKNGVASVDAMMLKAETIIDWMDGGNTEGVFNRIVFKPIAEAQHRETAMLKDYFHQVEALFKAVPGEQVSRWQDKTVLPFIDRQTGEAAVMQRHKVVAMALNVGNEGNLQRLSDGYGWDAGRIQQYLNDTLSKEEWQFVQGTWDTINKLWPEIEAMEKRVNGVAPEKVEPRSFDTPHGAMRGGYYPAIYDADRNLGAEERRGRDADLLSGNYTKASTVSGSTKDRAEKVVNQPLLLDLGVINRHLGEVIHDLTHREAVMQAWRFVTDQRVAAAVDKALGSAIRKQLPLWVKHVANSWASDRVGNEAFGKFITRLRANVTAVGLGLRATTILVHSSGLVYGSEVVGPKWMSQGIAAMAKDPIGTVRHVMDASPEVRAHLEHYDRDIGAMITRMDTSRPANKAVQHIRDAQKFMFHGIGWMVQKVSVPVWIGGYNKAISEGRTEDEARYAADKAVRQTMGNSGAKDLAAIQRSTGNWGQVTKLFTMFYTQMAAQYQRQRTLGRDVLGYDDRRPRDLPKLAARAFFLIGMAPMWDALIKLAVTGHGPDDDESWVTWIFGHMLANQLAPIPGARDVAEPIMDKLAGRKAFTPSVTPLESAYKSLITSAGDAGNVIHGQPVKDGVRHTLELAGYSTGLVPGQLAAATQFLKDVAVGAQHPDGVRQWINGLSTGHAAPKH